MTGIHELILNVKKFCRRRLALERFKDFFVKKSNICGLQLIYLKSWNIWLINHNLHVKHRGDFGTFCLSFTSRFAWAKPKPKLPHLFLPNPGVRRSLLQSFWKVGHKLWFINHNLWYFLCKFRTLRGAGEEPLAKKFCRFVMIWCRLVYVYRLVYHSGETPIN